MGTRVWSDADILTVLDLIEGQGLSASAMAAQFGVARGAICGLVFRVRADLEKSEAAPGPKAVKPENQDGALRCGWWAAGAWKQDNNPLYPKKAAAPKASRWGNRMGALEFRNRARG